MLKRLLLSTLIAFILLISVATPAVHAQSLGPWYHQNFDQWFVKVFDTGNQTEIFGERYTYAQVEWILYSLYSYAIFNLGVNAPEGMSCLMTKEVGQCVQQITSALSHNSTQESERPSFIAFMLQDRPLSGITYVKEIGRKLNLVKEANAQASAGIGYRALDEIRVLWQRTRDMTYIFFILIFIVLAFMIMFRVKLSPQASVSVQSSLPKIIVALILVTFSYGIAGFMIDIMYIVIGFIGLASGLDFSSFIIGFKGLPEGVLGMILAYLAGFALSLASGFNAALNGGLGGFVGMSIILVVALIVGLIVGVISAFKILWNLFLALAFVLLLTIIAPFQIALGVIMPGAGFSSWLKNFIANLAVFPVTGLLFYLAFTFLVIGIAKSGLPVAALLGTDFVAGQGEAIAGWPPLLNFAPQLGFLIYIGVSFAVFVTIPKASQLVKSLMQGRPFSFGTAIGEAQGDYMTWGGRGYHYGGKQVLGYGAKGIRSILGGRGLIGGGGAAPQ